MRTWSRVLSIAALLAAIGGCRDDALTAARPTAAGGPSRDLFTIIIPQPTDFVDITAGWYHTCARRYNGDTYCWGLNSSGQVGTGESDPFGQPSTGGCSGFPCVIAPTMIQQFRQVASGGFHNCGIDLNGRTLCWGEGTSGALGTGSASNEWVPRFVSGTVTFSTVAVGNGSTCAANSTGTIFCWGWIQSYAKTPTAISGDGYRQIAVGGQAHACALWVLGSTHEIHCWGNDGSGETGQDPANHYPTSLILNTAFPTTSYHVTSGEDFTCVDDSGGTVSCVGSNGVGQLGNGTGAWQGGITQTWTPQTVVIWQSLFRFRGFWAPAQLHGTSAGTRHSCALDNSGNAYCWGEGANGKLGNGGTSNVASPVLVAGGHTYRAIAAGGSHTCAIGTDNIIYCWGDGSVGQLGTGSYSDASLTPKPTAPPRLHYGI
jgi:alpha-tubulin suppressor-like RCC1 family protein